MLENAVSLPNVAEIIQEVQKLLGQNTQYANLKKKKKKKSQQSQQILFWKNSQVISINKKENRNLSAYIIIRRLNISSREKRNQTITQ